MNKKIGLVVTFNISSPGGAPRVVVDLINALNSMGGKVYLLTPYKLDFEKIEEYHGTIKVEKIYYPSRLKSFFCKEPILSRKFIKKEFQKMLKEVDMIIDMDGGVVHNYLPKDFDKSKYIVWRISCVPHESKKFSWMKKGIKFKIKKLIKTILGLEKSLPSQEHKIYALDKWTEQELIKYGGLHPEKMYLYPEIKVEEFLNKKVRKKNQIAIFGRISPNKKLEDSIKIFVYGTKKHPDYKLMIFGGFTPDSQSYVRYLKKIIKDLGVTKKIKIITNPSFEQLKKLLLESKILLDGQREASLTMTAIEAMAAGMIVLAYKNSNTFIEILENGKYGSGFLNAKEGGKELEKILEKLKNKKINNKQSIKRATDFSGEKFRERLRRIVDG